MHVWAKRRILLAIICFLHGNNASAYWAIGGKEKFHLGHWVEVEGPEFIYRSEWAISEFLEKYRAFFPGISLSEVASTREKLFLYHWEGFSICKRGDWRLTTANKLLTVYLKDTYVASTMSDYYDAYTTGDPCND